MTSVLDIVKHTQYGRSMGILGAGMALGNALGAPVGGKIGAIDPVYLSSLEHPCCYWGH